MLSGSPYHADRLTALMAKWVVDTVDRAVGEPPTAVGVHPSGQLDRVPAGHARATRSRDVGLATPS